MRLIRKAKREDCKKLAEISMIAHNELKGWTFEDAQRFQKIVKDVKQKIYVAIKESTIIGYVHTEWYPEKRRLYIEDIFVRKEERRKRIATLLIKKAIKAYTKRKHVNIVLLTADRNVTIFEKVGFKKTMNYMELKR
jgi:N-acetylglutamate synthase-like GNAT family acetyltransferase